MEITCVAWPSFSKDMNTKPEISTAELARRIRHHVIVMANRANASHIGSGLSIADILAVLYGRILRFDPQRPAWPERDRFILSKGHSCAALYAVLAECGFFPMQALETYYQNGTILPGHATHKFTPGVEASTGSLGHGLPLGVGRAPHVAERAVRRRIIVTEGYLALRLRCLCGLSLREYPDSRNEDDGWQRQPESVHISPPKFNSRELDPKPRNECVPEAPPKSRLS